MPSIYLRSAVSALACVSLLTIAAQTAAAQSPHELRREARQTPVCRPHDYGSPDLFYNFYVGPDCGVVGTQAYMAPHPVPVHVGHTYYTYQPFMPHELLYKHKRVYHRYYNEGRGLTRTSVRHW